MNRILLKAAGLAVTTLTACTPKTELIYNEGIPEPGSNNMVSELLICNPPKGLEWDLWGNFYAICDIPCRTAEDSMAEIVMFSGSCCRIEPKVAADTIVLRYDDAVRKYDWAPQGFFIKMRRSGKVFPVPITHNFQPADTMPRPTYKPSALAVTDIIPAVKEVDLLGGTSATDSVETRISEGFRPEGYRLTVKDGLALIEASDGQGLSYGRITLKKFQENAGGNMLPSMVVNDWPDFSHRAQFIDVARVFYPIDKLKKVIDILERSKINVLVLHLTEDESWRLEIEGLPELTEFGAFHDIPVRQADGSYLDETALAPIKGGPLGKGAFGGTSGFYSIEEFKDLLRYARERGIRVIPEVDIPGHSYSAIQAMKARERNTGDTSCRLVCPGDSSNVCSVQGYYDNVIDLSLPSVYTFLGKVFDSIRKTYAEAGVPLEEFGIGGDEVAASAWTGSPSCLAEMEELGLKDTHELRSLFIRRVNAMLRERGLKVSGYNEILENLSDEAFDEVSANCRHIWVWKRLNPEFAGTAYKYANKGIKVVLANCTHTYLELACDMSRREPGLSWAGTLDERKTYAFLPFSIGKSARFDRDNNPCNIAESSLWAPKLEKPENIEGIQAMLWGDNFWSCEDGFTAMFPKAFGLFERCWNAHPQWESSNHALDPAFIDGFNRFYTIVKEREFPVLDAAGLQHRKELEQE